MTSSTAHVALPLQQDPPSACPAPAASAASTDAGGHENGASHCSHCLTAHLVVVRGAGILVMPPVPSNSGTAAQPSSSTTCAHGAPAGGGGGGDADDHTSVVDLEALRKALEDACFSATGIHMTFDVCEGRAHTLTDDSTKAHTGVSGEELAGGLQRSPRKQMNKGSGGISSEGGDVGSPVSVVDGDDQQHMVDNPLDAKALTTASPKDDGVEIAPTDEAQHTHAFNLTEDQQQALNERGPITLVPEVIGKSISQTRIVDVPWFYQALNSRVGIITCILVSFVSGGVTMLPHHLQEQRSRDVAYALGGFGYGFPHLLLFLTFYRDKCAMILRSFEFWYMVGHCSFIIVLIGVKYVSSGVNPYLVWPCTCLGIPALTANLMMDASPFPLLLRTFFNFIMFTLWLFWTVAMAESEIFYNDAVVRDFGRQRNLGRFHSDLRVMYCSSAFTVALFFGRYVVNGMLGNEHALLKANLVRRPAPLQYMESSHDSPVMRQHGAPDDTAPILSSGTADGQTSTYDSSAGIAFATRRGRRSTKILRRAKSRTSVEVTNGGAFFVM